MSRVPHVHSRGCGCATEAQLGELKSLDGSIKQDDVVVLNESVPDSGKRVFKEVEDVRELPSLYATTVVCYSPCVAPHRIASPRTVSHRNNAAFMRSLCRP